MSEVVIQANSTNIIVQPNSKDLVVRPVNKDIVLLPRETVITLQGDMTNFATVGDTTVEYQDVAVEEILACEVVVETATGWELADANNLSHFSLAAGIALTTGLTGQSITGLIDGKIENAKWLWTVGDPLFISTTPGQLVNTPDPGAAFVRLIGWVLTPTLIHVTQHDGTLL